MRQPLNNRAMWVAGIVIAAVLSIALIFATTGFAGFDFRPAGEGAVAALDTCRSRLALGLRHLARSDGGS